MSKSMQIAVAFAFGVVFVTVMLTIAIAIPFPSGFQLLTFRVTLALAAGGVAAMLPGFLNVEVKTFIRASGASAAFTIIYFFNPAELPTQGTPTQSPGLFVVRTGEDAGLVEYYWKQAGLRFRFPKNGWTIATKAAEAGLGDMTLQHTSGKDAQIQLHVSVLDDKYRNDWEEFETNTVDLWKGTISQFGPFESQSIFVNGRSSLRIRGVIKGQVNGLKQVTMIYAPLGDNRLFEILLTRNTDSVFESELSRAFELIASTVEFDRI